MNKIIFNTKAELIKELLAGRKFTLPFLGYKYAYVYFSEKFDEDFDESPFRVGHIITKDESKSLSFDDKINFDSSYNMSMSIDIKYFWRYSTKEYEWKEVILKEIKSSLTDK